LTASPFVFPLQDGTGTTTTTATSVFQPGSSSRYLDNPAGVVDGSSDGAQIQPVVGAQRRHLLLGVLGDRIHVEAGECLPVHVSFLEDGSPVSPDLHARQCEHLE
jgi:hypothetical protein